MKNIKIKIIFIITIAIAFIAFLKFEFLREVIYLIIISFILSYALKPLVRLVVNKGYNIKMVSLILILGTIGIFLLCFSVLIPTLVRESMNISKAFEDIENIINNIYEKVNVSNNKIYIFIYESINEKLNRLVMDISTNFFDNIISLGENIMSLAVIPVITYYFLSEGSLISNKLLLFLPVEKRKIIKKVGKNIDKILGRYILSQFILCLLIGVLTFVILSIFKVNFPFLLSLVNAVFNIIPYFGPLFGAIPSIFLALTQSYEKAIWVTLFLYLIQQIEGDIISPKIIGDSISMHPLIIILLLILGGKIGGFIGMVLAVPVGVVIKVIYEDINYYLF
ncbi:AI-2E family transporter [Desnuesiella massiliensis]|uniref:AI-2E family transporter n=1 Tax=Desnuesiella massiliensis TaxID=1650662 RepID=UPI0006E27D24|nr:AI-2E family transporter [Desnuesiella massiliensis]